MQTLLSILVVNYNTREFLRGCLNSIQASESRGIEVLVVDNHSSDGSMMMVRTEFAGARLIENSENLGFAKANNQAIRIASGKYVLLLNSDTVVQPGALESMLEFMEAHPDAGGVTCRLLNADGTIQACVSKKPGLVLLVFRLSGLSRLLASNHIRLFVRKYFGILLGSSIRSYLEPYVSMNPFEVENISGACLMLRRTAIEEVGLLDEAFFMYMEDVDYCIRLRKAGWKLYYAPAGEIVHLVGQSSGGRMRSYSVHAYRSLFHFYNKHYPASALSAVRLIVLSAMSLHWLWITFLGAASGSSVQEANRLDIQKVIRLCFGWHPFAAGTTSQPAEVTRSKT